MKTESENRPPRTIQKIFPAMGTIHSITIFDSGDVETLNRAKNLVLALDKRWSIYREDSELSALNRSAGRSPVVVSDDTLDVLQKAERYRKLTDGAFDILTAPLNRLWKQHIREGTYPNPDEVRTRLIGSHEIRIDTMQRSAFISGKGQAADLGGIAKGYVADRIKKIFEESGVHNAHMNLVGTIFTIGGDREVGIQNPFQPTGTPMGTVTVRNKAVVSSGTYEHCAAIGRKFCHHIIDPRTGYPSDSGVRSATLIGENTAELDALATAVCVLGAAEGFEVLRRRNIEAVLILEDGEILVTPNLEGKIRLDQTVLSNHKTSFDDLRR